MSNLMKKILHDIKIELTEEFDRNFERKAFFDQPWEKRKREVRGTILMGKGRLRRSIRSRLSGSGVHFSSDAPYAAIHNEGGKIKITAKMRRYFWAMYYKNANKVVYSIKTRQVATKHGAKLSAEAEYWRNMALTKKDKFTIPKRQFIGSHTVTDKAIRAIVDENLRDYISQNIDTKLNPFKR